VSLGQSVLPAVDNYDALRRQFRWQVPATYNIGVDVCDRWAQVDPGRTAIIHLRPDGGSDQVSYGALRESSNRLANALRAHGVARGDRVAILLPQMPEVAAIHIAVYKLAAVALPLATLFGVDAIAYRLQNSGAKALITNAAGLAKLADVRAQLPDLELVLSLDGAADGAKSFADTVSRASSDLTPEVTAPDHPALMVYTSGTTGQPKGALHAHRVLLGHLPGIEMPHEFFPQHLEADVLYVGTWRTITADVAELQQSCHTLHAYADCGCAAGSYGQNGSVPSASPV